MCPIIPPKKSGLHLGCLAKRDAIIYIPWNAKVSVGVSTSGKSADFDSAIRRFEPCHPYHPSKELLSGETYSPSLWHL
jgi:hypothetical protein